MPARAIVRSLHVYPVKGCAAVDADAIAFDADGLIVGDRQLMIVDADGGAFVSQRHEPRLATLRAIYAIDAVTLATPDDQRVVSTQDDGPTRAVTVWDDTFDAIDLGDAAARWLSAWLGRAVRLVQLPARSPRSLDPYWADAGTRTSFADLAPVLVASTASLDDLNARRTVTGHAPIEMARFRPNVVVDGMTPWMEDDVAALAGDAGTLRLIKPCARCKVIELAPTTGDATGDDVLASLAAFRAGRNRRGSAGVFFGVNATFTGPAGGVLRRGDSLDIRIKSTTAGPIEL